MFIRKRDPRYVKETIDEAKLQASLLAASQLQAARAKANFQETLNSFQTQDWMKVDEGLYQDEDSEETDVEEEFECVACKKNYKTERSFSSRLIVLMQAGSSMLI
jgi:DnaJ homolog subfamily A member 5